MICLQELLLNCALNTSDLRIVFFGLVLFVKFSHVSALLFYELKVNDRRHEDLNLEESNWAGFHICCTNC